MNTPNTEAPKKSLWILSPAADTVFFFLSGLLGLLFGFVAPHLGNGAVGISFLIYFVLGLTHFGSTWFFYLDESNRQYFNTKPWAFYYIPFLLIVAPIGFAVTKFSILAIVITYWFSGYHVMKQGIGITSLYRGRLGLFAPTERETDNLVIMSASFLALFGRYLLFSDFGFEGMFGRFYGKYLVWAILAVFVYALIKWIMATVRRFNMYGRDALPLFSFTLVSLLLFAPFLYVKDFQIAFMSNLLGHYSQYLVLVWLINRNKYAMTGETPPKAPILSYLAKHGYLYAAVLIGYAIAVTLLGQVSILLPVVGLTWAHFYVDRFLFRFKDPEVRKLILPYI